MCPAVTAVTEVFEGQANLFRDTARFEGGVSNSQHTTHPCFFTWPSVQLSVGPASCHLLVFIGLQSEWMCAHAPDNDD